MKTGTGPLLKGLTVALVALMVLAPVQMLRGLIEERARLRRAPTADIDWFVLPESLTLESELKVLDERRKLGVYEVPVYVANAHAEATFNIESRIAELMHSQSGAVVRPQED